MHCNKCNSKDTDVLKCPNCKQNSSVKCKACGNQYCSDKYCEIVALHGKRKQLSRIAIFLFGLILCTVPSTFAVMSGIGRKVTGRPESPPTPPPPQPTPPAPPKGQPPIPPAAGAASPTAKPPIAANPPAQGTPPTPAPPAQGTPPPPATPPAPPVQAAVPPPPATPPAGQPAAPPVAAAPAAQPAPPAPPAPPSQTPEQQWENLGKMIEASLGTPYKKDGSNPQEGGVDAPGYVQWIYGQIGHAEITRDYGVLSKAGAEVQGTDFKPGDILLFSIKKDGNVNFAGLYLKEGKFVYPFPKDQKVIQGDANNDFFKQRFVGARRVVK